MKLAKANNGNLRCDPMEPGEMRMCTRTPFWVGFHSSWLRRRVVEPLLGLLTKGLSPRGLAWSLAAGLALGVFPMLGSTTLLCLAVAYVFGLNQPAMQLANYLAYPLQLILLIPFYRLGARLFGIDSSTLLLPAMLHTFKLDPSGSLVHLWSMIWHAMVIWAFLALPAMVLLAFLVHPLLAAAARRLRAIPEGRGRIQRMT